MSLREQELSVVEWVQCYLSIIDPTDKLHMLINLEQCDKFIHALEHGDEYIRVHNLFTFPGIGFVVHTSA